MLFNSSVRLHSFILVASLGLLGLSGCSDDELQAGSEAEPGITGMSPPTAHESPVEEKSVSADKRNVSVDESASQEKEIERAVGPNEFSAPLEQAHAASENLTQTDMIVSSQFEDNSITPGRNMMTGDEQSNRTQSNHSLIFIIIILSFSTLLSIAISFWLYRWRRILLGNLKALAPEEFAEHVKYLDGKLGNHEANVIAKVHKITENVSDLGDITRNMVQTFMGLQKSLDAKDKEIARYKNGYDSTIFKKFVNRFLKIDQAIEEYLHEDNEHVSSQLKEVRELLQDALDDCGVEAFSPELSCSYKSAEGVADRPKIVETDVAEDDGFISEIIKQGYRLRSGDCYEILVPAKVAVYVLSKKEE